jgi:hypothetical protein
MCIPKFLKIWSIFLNSQQQERRQMIFFKEFLSPMTIFSILYHLDLGEPPQPNPSQNQVAQWNKRTSSLEVDYPTSKTFASAPPHNGPH